jgi:mRNA interferase HicA
MSDTIVMKGSEFIRKVQNLGRRTGRKVDYVPHRGKGIHGTLYYGDRLTIVRNPKDELKKGTLHAMVKRLEMMLTSFEESGKEKESATSCVFINIQRISLRPRKVATLCRCLIFLK